MLLSAFEASAVSETTSESSSETFSTETSSVSETTSEAFPAETAISVTKESKVKI
jgi:hypothetical protein